AGRADRPPARPRRAVPADRPGPGAVGAAARGPGPARPAVHHAGHARRPAGRDALQGHALPHHPPGGQRARCSVGQAARLSVAGGQPGRLSYGGAAHYHERKETTMNTTNRLALAGLLAGAMFASAQPAGAPALPKVSYADLGKLVRGHRGKVVVVYFWADY